MTDSAPGRGTAPACPKPDRNHMLDLPGYREAHDKVDALLDDCRGLIFALDATIEAHPQLHQNTRETEALRALVRMLGERLEATIPAQSAIWRAAGVEAQS